MQKQDLVVRPATKEESQRLQAAMKERHVDKYGNPVLVGTELRKLIEWFPLPKNSKQGCGRCRSLEIKYNRWGIEKCEANIDRIVKRLGIAAKRRGLPAIDMVIRPIVQQAIASAKKGKPPIIEKQLKKNDGFVVERCFLINLDRRPDRLKTWIEQRPDPWPFPEVERFAAVDGQKCVTPSHWKAGRGAWGCYRSHLTILEKCLQEGVESYVVFEDDAGFVADFSERFQQYASELPDDWGLAYIGGQHLYAKRNAPKRISQSVYRPFNVNRTHAFMVRGRENMKKLYKHLTSKEWHPKHHIDHHLGKMIQRQYHGDLSQAVPTYVPAKWLSCQLPGKSNINGKRWDKSRFWNDAARIDVSNHPFFAVLGPHRSGTSCVAMVMHKLGVHMGNQLGGYEATGGGEAAGLARLCEKAMRFPLTEPKMPSQRIARLLGKWARHRKQEAISKNTFAGGKYPHLCRMANELHEALGDSLRIVAVDRPIKASIRSLQSRSAKHPNQWFSASDDECEALQVSLLTYRDKFIQEHSEVPVYRVDFARLTQEPEAVIYELIAFLGISPTEEQIKEAITHVNPKLRKHG